MGEMRIGNNIFVGKPEGSRPLEKHRLGWEDNIKTYLKEIRWECGLDGIGSNGRLL
jgi:hypothetical protein